MLILPKYLPEYYRNRPLKNKTARTRTAWDDKTSNEEENNESSNTIRVGDIVVVVND